MSSESIPLGLCPIQTCSYLPKQNEQIAVVFESRFQTPQYYEAFLDMGFRRSGEMIYRPNCPSCQACQSIRILTPAFKPSRSQKRLIKQAQKLAIRWQVKDKMDENWYPLYDAYICARHRDGSMYPPDRKTFESFSQSEWLNVKYLHLYQDEKLIAIAVIDVLADSLSAFYTFFDPENPLSLGSLAILYQVEVAQINNKKWLYLGFQIDECPAMSYKDRYHPHQKLVNQTWQG
ncbi:MAG: arginyltransferase [Vibrio sp.]